MNKAIALFIFCALVCLAFFPAFHAEFLIDDDKNFLINPMMKDFRGLVDLWTTTTQSDYYPLTWTNFWVQTQLWAKIPQGFHAVNLLMFTLEVWLLYLVLRKLQLSGAFWIAALFAVHPLQVESAAWVTELKNLQSGAFFFSSLLCFLNFEEEKKKSDYILSLVFFAASLLSKASTVMLPLIILLTLWWKYGTLSKRDFLKLTPFFILSLLSAVITLWFQHHQGGASTSAPLLQISERLQLAGMSSWFYLQKIFWPFELGFPYPRWKAEDFSWVPSFAALLLFGVFWFKRKEWGRHSFALLFAYFLFLLPVLGFVDIYFFQYSYVADRWMHLALLAPILAFVALLIFLRQKFLTFAAEKIVFVLLILGLIPLSWRRTEDFTSLESFWNASLRVNPEAAMAYNGLGCLYIHNLRLNDSIPKFEKAIQLQPDYSEAYFNYGITMNLLGQTDRARELWESSIQKNPRFHPGRLALAQYWMDQGNFERAKEQLEAAAAQRPFDPRIQQDLRKVNALIERQRETPKK